MPRAQPPPAEARKRQQDAQDQRQADVLWFVSDPRGRRLLAGWLRDLGLLGLSHTPGDPIHTAFREGQRSAAVSLHAAVTLAAQDQAPALLAEVMKPADV